MHEALRDTNWRKAMDAGFGALQSSKTWHLVPPRENVNIIESKWVYKIKRKSYGTIDNYKARLIGC
jgi:hypothetical protein